MQPLEALSNLVWAQVDLGTEADGYYNFKAMDISRMLVSPHFTDEKN